MSNYKQALDGAKAVVVSDEYDTHLSELMAVWYGGTTVNIYEIGQHGIHEIDVFTRMDDEGRPVDRNTIVEEMREHLEHLRSEE